MFKILKIAALSLLVSTGFASAATISGEAVLGGSFVTSDGLDFAAGSTLDLTSDSATGTGSYAGLVNPGSPFSIETTVGANVGTIFDFPIFSFQIVTTSVVVDVLGQLLVGGTGLADDGPGGLDASLSSWVLSVANIASPNGAWTMTITTPPGTLPGVPLPAGLPLLAGGLALFGVLRKRATA